MSVPGFVISMVTAFLVGVAFLLTLMGLEVKLTAGVCGLAVWGLWFFGFVSK